MKKVPTATCALKDRKIVSIERVYTPSNFYMKSVVLALMAWNIYKHGYLQCKMLIVNCIMYFV